MGHYDECRDGYCGICGQADGFCEHTKNELQTKPKQTRTCTPTKTFNTPCDQCCKEDVCSIKNEMIKAVSDIHQIADRTNVFLTYILHCKKEQSKLSTARSGICP